MFRRIDNIRGWTRSMFYPGAVLVMPTRAFLFFGIIFVDAILVYILSIGHDYSKGPMKGIKKQLVLIIHYYVNMAILGIAGMSVEVVLEDMDYKYWLGPNYLAEVKKLKRSSTLVSTHSSWLDGFIMGYLFQPAATPAADVIGDLPIFYTIFESLDSIIAYRGNDLKRRSKVA